MTKPLRRIFLVALTILIIMVGGMVFINYQVKQKVENFLDYRLPDNVVQSHEGLRLDSFEGTITLLQPKFAIKNATNDSIHTTVQLEKLIVEDVSYWDYLFNDEIHIEDIKLKQPRISYYPDQFQKNTSRSTPKGIVTLYKPLRIDELSIDNAYLHIYENKQDSILLYVENATLEIDDIFIDRSIITKRLPVTFRDNQAKADSVFLKTSDLDVLTIGSFRLKERKAKLQSLAWKTKASPQALSRMLTKEKDHIDLRVPEIEIEGIDFGFSNRRLFTKSTHINIAQPVLRLYRDKLVADDAKHKKLYSQLLRELPLDLTIDSVTVLNGDLTYTEKVKPGMAGAIRITEMNSTLNDLSNTYEAPVKTKILTTGKFMEVSPFTTQWTFDVQDPNDRFTFTMEGDRLPAADLNSFTEPNLRIRLKGILEKNYLTINGNARTSHIDMRLKYDDFKIEVLTSEGTKKNWLLSTVANLIVANDSKSKESVFREGSAQVSRDPSKSIFNFIWLNIRSGLLKTMTGNGKK